MAIQTNKSTEEVVGSVKYWQGVGNFKVVAINPTMEEAIAIGVNLKNEPNYTNIQVGTNVRNKIVFFVRNEEHDITTRVEFLVSPDIEVSQNGNQRIINNRGRHTWSKDIATLKANPKMSWFNTEKARYAYVGEAELIDFISAWANVASDGEVSLDTIDVIVKGNVTELRKLMASIRDNEVKLLLGVKVADDGKLYQQVYGKFYGRPYIKTLTSLIKNLSDEYGAFKAQYDPHDFTLKQFTGETMRSTNAAATTGADAEDDTAPWNN
jgi:hypothetical protein